MPYITASVAQTHSNRFANPLEFDHSLYDMVKTHPFECCSYIIYIFIIKGLLLLLVVSSESLLYSSDILLCLARAVPCLFASSLHFFFPSGATSFGYAATVSCKMNSVAQRSSPSSHFNIQIPLQAATRCPRHSCHLRISPPLLGGRGSVARHTHHQQGGVRGVRWGVHILHIFCMVRTDSADFAYFAYFLAYFP